MFFLTARKRKQSAGVLLLLFFLVSLLTPWALAAQDGPAGFAPLTESLLLLDLNTGETVYERNADEVRPMASTTKIMTYIITAENVDLETAQMPILEEPLKEIEGRGASVCGLEDLVGRTLPVLEVLYGLMVPSGCDAGAELGWYVGNGDMQAFVDLMNEKAAELGCTNTHYVDAHGLGDGNTTTAKELSVIARYAMTLPHFEEIVNTTEHTLPGASGPVYNSNAMLSPINGGRYYYPYTQGIKTGYTYEAGRCLVSTAVKGDQSYMCVALGGEYDEETNFQNNAMLDTRSLYEWAFERFTDNIEIDIPRRLYSLQIGSSVTLEPETESPNHETPEITWTSSAPEIVSVNENGTLTAHSLGEAMITAETQTGNKDNCFVSAGYYNGIEVSEASQDYSGSEPGPADWAGLKTAGADFVIIRADSALAASVEGATFNGIPYGVSIPATATDSEGAKAEAAALANTLGGLGIGPEQLAIPVAYELSTKKYKDNSEDTNTQIVLAFAQAMSDQGYSVQCAAAPAVTDALNLPMLTDAGVSLWYLSPSRTADLNSIETVGDTIPLVWEHRSNLYLPQVSEGGQTRENLYYMASALHQGASVPTLTVTSTDDGKTAVLEWTASDEDCTGYRVWREAESTGLVEQVATVTDSLSLEDTGTPGENYHYTVSALFPDALHPDSPAEVRGQEVTFQFAGKLPTQDSPDSSSAVLGDSLVDSDITLYLIVGGIILVVAIISLFILMRRGPKGKRLR